MSPGTMRCILRSRPARRGLVTLGAAVLGLVVAEVAAGVEAAPPRPLMHGVLLRASQDKRLETEHVPGARQQVLFRDRGGRTVRKVEHVISDSGWRGPAFSKTGERDVYRIICVGDSHTFGHGVEEWETWPQALEGELSERLEGRLVEVLNFGVGGYDGARKVALIEQRALACEPDLILLQLYMNDIPVGHGGIARRARHSALIRLAQPGREGWVRELRQRSNLVDLLLSRIFTDMCLDNYMRDNNAGFEPTNRHWKDLQDRLRACRDRLAERDVRLVIVLYPLLFEQDGVLASHGIGQVIGAFCDAEQLPFVDLEQAFLGCELTSLRIHPHDYHLTGEGHALAAHATVEALLGIGVLDDPGQRQR